jgi:hypothetical protein
MWFAYLQLARPRRVREAARHAEQHHGVPPLDEEIEYQPAEQQHTGRALMTG